MKNNPSTFFIYFSWWRYKACNYTWRSVVKPLLSQIVFQNHFSLKTFYYSENNSFKWPFRERWQCSIHNGTFINSIMWKICSFLRFKRVYFWYFLYMLPCSRNAQVTFLEKPHLKKIRFPNYRHLYLIYTWWDKALKFTVV